MSSIRLPPQPRRVLLCHDSRLNKHVIWTQDFSSSRGWLMPKEHDASMAVSADPRHRGTPSASIISWAFSHPINNHFIFVTHLTVSNYDNFKMQDVLTVLDSVPRLQELELCRVNIIDRTTGPFARPANMVRSLNRLAIEACNITEGYLDGYYDLLFRFIALFEHIGRLRLAATIFRDEDTCVYPAYYNIRLPTIVHLEAEGFFSYVLLTFFQLGYPVQTLLSLHLSRCFSAWQKLFRLEQIVRIVSPTLQHFAFRPNLEANASSTDGLGPLFHDFAQALGQCTELRELELGLYARGRGDGVEQATRLFRPMLEALPAARLTHLAVVLDLDSSFERFSPGNAVPWSRLDAQLSRVCVPDNGCPLLVRINRCVLGYRAWERGVDYKDQRYWYRRLPTMLLRTRVEDRLRDGRLSVGQCGAPMGIDVQRNARLVAPGLRSLFD